MWYLQYSIGIMMAVLLIHFILSFIGIKGRAAGFNFYPPYVNRIMRRINICPVLSGINERKNRPEKQYLRRVKNPDQQNSYNSGRPINAGQIGRGNVMGNYYFTNGEQSRRHPGTNPDIPPMNMRIGQELIKRSKQNGNYQSRHGQVKRTGKE